MSLVHLDHLLLKILGIAGGEFLHGVHTCSLEKLGKLRTYTLDAEKVGMIDPCKDELCSDSGLLLESLAALCGLSLFKELVCIVDTCCCEFLGISRSDSFDVYDIVSHDSMII